MVDRVEELLSIITQGDLVRLLKGSHKHLEPKTAAVYLMVSVRCLEEWRRKGVGPKWKKVRRRVFYRFNDLDAYLAHGDQLPPSNATAE